MPHPIMIKVKFNYLSKTLKKCLGDSSNEVDLSTIEPIILPLASTQAQKRPTEAVRLVLFNCGKAIRSRDGARGGNLTQFDGVVPK